MEHCTVDGQRLSLVGSGMRRVVTVTIYEARLFAAGPVRRAEDLYGAAAPLRLQFKYLYGPIGRARMAQAWDTALRKAVPAQGAAAVDAFVDTIADYHRGDTVHYDLLPDGTVQVTQNGAALASIASHALRAGILDVMVGEQAFDAGLRAALVPALAEPRQAA